MKVRQSRSTHRGAGTRGILLVECIVYIGLLVVVLGAAFALFYRCWDNSHGLWRNTDDIVRALKAGERWREDVRAATGPLQLIVEEDAQALEIPQRTNRLVYIFAKDGVWRLANTNSAWLPALAKVQSSRLQADTRQHVTSWRWELELTTHRKVPLVCPKFTFQAVPGSVSNR